MTVAAPDPVAASLADRFVGRYDEVMRQPWVAPFYEGSGFFDTGYWDDGVAGQRAACERLVAVLAEEVARRLGGPPAALVDAGCGLGATTLRLAELFPAARVTGVNLSPRQVASARRRARAGVDFVIGDAARLDLPAASFDAVVSVEAAFHFATRQAFFAAAARVLRPGGCLALSDILYRDLSVVGEWMVPAANRLSRLDTYAGQLAAAGFEAVEVTDATEQCWDGFCRSLGRFFAGQRERGEIDAPTFAGLSGMVSRLEGCVAHYLLAAATRSAG